MDIEYVALFFAALSIIVVLLSPIAAQYFAKQKAEIERDIATREARLNFLVSVHSKVSEVYAEMLSSVHNTYSTRWLELNSGTHNLDPEDHNIHRAIFLYYSGKAVSLLLSVGDAPLQQIVIDKLQDAAQKEDFATVRTATFDALVRLGRLSSDVSK